MNIFFLFETSVYFISFLTSVEEFESRYIPLQQKAFTYYHEQAPRVLEAVGPEVKKMFAIINEMGNLFQDDNQN